MVTAESGAFKNSKDVWHILKNDGKATFSVPGYKVVSWESNKPKLLTIDPVTGEATYKKTGKGIKVTATLENGEKVVIPVTILKDKAFASDLTFEVKVKGKWTVTDSVDLAPGKGVSTRLKAGEKGKLIIESVTFTDDIATRSATKATANLKAKKAKISDGKETLMTIKANGQTFTLKVKVYKGAKDLGPLAEETAEIIDVEELN